MRKNAGFALKLPEIDGTPLPHAKEMKVQVGGLLGLQSLLFTDKRDAEEVDDIDLILQTALQQYQEFEKLPFAEVIKSVTNFKGRQRRSKE